MTKLTTNTIHTLLFLAPMIFTIPAFSQSSTDPKNTFSTALENKQWDLDRFLWGYARNKPQTGDKFLIDFNVINNWQGLAEYLSVSNDGKFLAFTIERGIGLEQYRKVDSLIVQSVNDSWRYVLINTKPGFFSGDSKQYVYQEKEKLCLLKLGTGEVKSIEGVSSYKLPPNDHIEWLAYQLKGNPDALVLHNFTKNTQTILDSVTAHEFDVSGKWLICNGNRTSDILLYNLSSGARRRFSNVVNYAFDDDGHTLVIHTTDNTNLTKLEYINLFSASAKIIWESSDTTLRIGNYSIDQNGTQVAFTITKMDQVKPIIQQKSNSIWYYRQGMQKGISIATNQTMGIESGLQIQETVSFTDNGHYIQFSLQHPGFRKFDPTGAQLDIWNHKDLMLQSSQAFNGKQARLYNAVINVDNYRILQLNTDGITISELQGDFAVAKKSNEDIYGDRFWKYNADSTWVVCLKDGSRRLLPTKCDNIKAWFSPGGKYLIYFDPDNGCHYFSYDLQSGNIADISRDVPEEQLTAAARYKLLTEQKDNPFGIAGWLHEDAGVLVYDSNDIWQLDLAGKAPAINVTRGFGRSNGIIFSLMDNYRFQMKKVVKFRKKNESVLLRAFNSNNKYNGFYRAITGVSKDPKLLNMGPYFINGITACHDGSVSATGIRPTKAGGADSWIVQRQSVSDAPNYYQTRDFKVFKRLTNYQPQVNYCWTTEELHTFTHVDGKKGQGILYKPQNFDSSKKYPVLIVFYGLFSNNIYQFPIPVYNRDALTPGKSPVWFVNNGYLVFTPDIYVSPLKYGPQALNVIEGAAQYLKTLPYVDADCLGICSHSWSAKLGAYIFTHSRSFTATAISEGYLYANMINVALSNNEEGMSQLDNVERSFHFGNLWENKNLWIDQTTVLNAERSNSPLLLICNKKSSSEYQNQTLQFFNALRRLERPVWWLKYDKGGHNLYDLDELQDYTIRFTQFFDHYLKRAPAPKWMTQGIPYALRGTVSRYELDPTGTCSLPDKNDCKICKKWNEQYKKLPGMFKRPIGEWHLD